MNTVQSIELAKNYVTLSNNHDLVQIERLFAVDATYYFPYFG